MLKPTFKAFLSHRYKSPDVNQRFFEVLATYGNLQFEVDVGTKATNVTRLERFVRDADAFVGIYPFPSDDDARPDFEAAMQASRYFRLELDLAVRSRRPALVFVDGRYGTAITVPQTIREVRYDHREVRGIASDRQEAGLRAITRAFCEEVAAVMKLRADPAQPLVRDRVGILLPRGKGSTAGYSKRQVAQIEDRLTQMSLRPVPLDWRAVVDGGFMRELENLDWAIVDIGAAACSAGLPAFLHGHFIPQLRVMRNLPDVGQLRSPLETTLLAGFEVGYPKDIIRWRDGKTLDREFLQRLTTLYEPRKYIGTSDEARAYFSSAALRNEVVFLSYSGDERDLASGVAKALRRRFQQVFDYRDQGESIVPGRRWIEEVFDKLAASAIGVPLLSPSYFTSGNCTHEARQMMALADGGKLRVMPVKIKEGPLELPSWMQDVQYVRGWEYSTPEQLVDRIVSAYDAAKPRKPANKGMQPTAQKTRRG